MAGGPHRKAKLSLATRDTRLISIGAATAYASPILPQGIRNGLSISGADRRNFQAESTVKIDVAIRNHVYNEISCISECVASSA